MVDSPSCRLTVAASRSPVRNCMFGRRAARGTQPSLILGGLHPPPVPESPALAQELGCGQSLPIGYPAAASLGHSQFTACLPGPAGAPCRLLPAGGLGCWPGGPSKIHVSSMWGQPEAVLRAPPQVSGSRAGPQGWWASCQTCTGGPGGG